VSALDELWFGESLAARAARATLWPASALFGAVVRARAAMYDRGLVPVHVPVLPVLSIGNVSVGGTGKTPVAAWAAARLRAAGAHPALLLRGYGGDEPVVHAKLNPDVPVLANADRVAGVREARARGADCVVLDDAFQHRRLARVADWVLVAAERGTAAERLLPAGPAREPASALRRADVVLVTRKSATRDAAEDLAARIARDAGVETAICHLALDSLVDALTEASHPLERLRGARLLAVAAIGAPASFFAQLRAAGAAELRTVTFRDHHAFDSSDVARLLANATRADAVVCTLKDAVKLVPLWPHGAMPLWYVSLHARIERAERVLDASLERILSARAIASSTAGDAG
jgi:tetraacyldisaccharide 4'-kinase